MSNYHVDPLFNPVTKPVKLSKSTEIITASVVPPKSTSGQTMQMVEGAFKGKVFKMWVDLNSRITIPVKD